MQLLILLIVQERVVIFQIAICLYEQFVLERLCLFQAFLMDFGVQSGGYECLRTVGIGGDEVSITVVYLDGGGDGLEYFIDIFLGYLTVLLDEDIGLSLPIVAGDDWFVGGYWFEPVVLEGVCGGCVDVVDVGVEVALADVAAVVLGLVVDTACRIRILVDVDVLHQVILEVFHLVLLVQLAPTHCLLYLADDHVAPPQQDHEQEGHLYPLQVLIHPLNVQQDPRYVLHLHHLVNQLRNYHVDALCLRESQVVRSHHRVTSLLAGVNEARPWILDDGFELGIFGVLGNGFDLIEQEVHHSFDAARLHGAYLQSSLIFL